MKFRHTALFLQAPQLRSHPSIRVWLAKAWLVISSPYNKLCGCIIRWLVRTFEQKSKWSKAVAVLCGCMYVLLFPFTIWSWGQVRKAILHPAAFGVDKAEPIDVKPFEQSYTVYDSSLKRCITKEYAAREEIQLEGKDCSVRSWLINSKPADAVYISKQPPPVGVFNIMLPGTGDPVAATVPIVAEKVHLQNQPSYLLIERPNEGGSTGDVSIEAQAHAILKGIEYLVKNHQQLTINLIGISMGAAAMLEAAVQGLEAKERPWGTAKINLHLFATFSQVHRIVSPWIGWLAKALMDGPNNEANLETIYQHNLDHSDQMITTTIYNGVKDDLIPYDRASLEAAWLNKGHAIEEAGIYCPGKKYPDLAFHEFSHNSDSWQDTWQLIQDTEQRKHFNPQIS